MSLFDSYTRDQLRQAYADAWKKNVDGRPLTALEAMLADVIGLHPEYQRIVGDANAVQALDADVTQASENPFLHMGLHMAVREQLSIDRPPGIRGLMHELQSRHGDPHAAEHHLMEALAETLWEAQRCGRPPDEARYLNLARRHGRDSGKT